MSKKRKQRSTSSPTQQRGTSVTTSPLLLNIARSLLAEVEDRRTFHPARHKPARGFSKLSVAIKARPKGDRARRGLSKYGGLKPDTFSFTKPSSVAICIRRKERREVLFAKRKTGKGARSFRKRNYYSDVSCR